MNNNKLEEKTNADYLKIMANIILILSIIVTGILILPSLISLSAIINGYSTDTNTWSSIMLGIITLVSGFSVFFLFRTVADIYRKVEK